MLSFFGPLLLTALAAVVEGDAGAESNFRTKMKAMKKKAIIGRQIQFTPLLTTGQHAPSSGACISTTLKGKPCPLPLPADKEGYLRDGVPYCQKCRQTGDPSLLKTEHPKFGKILVAGRDLPKGYRMAWFGDRISKKECPDPDLEWGLDLCAFPGKGIINARPYQKGSLLQFCACPGPNERVTVWMGPACGSQLDKSPLACLLFSTRMNVPKNYHLCMMYNEDEKSTDTFFRERGLTRADVGTKKYPCIRKARKKVKKLNPGQMAALHRVSRLLDKWLRRPGAKRNQKKGEEDKKEKKKKTKTMTKTVHSKLSALELSANRVEHFLPGVFASAFFMLALIGVKKFHRFRKSAKGLLDI